MGCLPACCFNLKDILDANDKSEPVPHLEDIVRIIIDWSEWRDLNYFPTFFPHHLYPKTSL